MQQTSRTGATGALLDEYERAVADLKQVISAIPDRLLPTITDAATADEHCRSVQAILSHVVHAGFGYANSIHQLKHSGAARPPKTFHGTVRAYREDLDRMAAFTETVLGAFTDSELEQLDNDRKIRTGWGQQYDPEQLMEHAIVHVLRHRRQLERIRQQQGW